MSRIPIGPSPLTTTPSIDARSSMDAALFSPRRDRTASSDFASVLGKAQAKADETPEEFARRSAESFVAIGLIQPLLQQLRESNHAAPPFAPTGGEKQFQGLMDAELAQRMVQRTNFPLVERITAKLLEKHNAKPAAQSTQPTDRTWALGTEH